MNEDMVMQLGQQTLKVTAMVSAPLLLSVLVIGLLISVLQAVTQINEATLTFIPKMVVVAVVLIIAGPWMLDTLTHFTTGLFENIADMVRQ